MESTKCCQFAFMSALYMAVWLSCSIIAPFFTPEAISKGANQAAAGLVFGAFSVTSFIVGPAFGSLVTTIGGKRMFLIGTVSCGCSNIIFGLLVNIQNATIFVTSAVLVRILEALGSSAAMVAAMATVAGNYPEHAPQMVGLLEMFSGLAFMFGPITGTLLYQVGGYELPFFTLGGFCLLLTALNVIILPQTEVFSSQTDSPLSLLRAPSVWSVAFTLLVTTASLAVFTVGVSYHAVKVGLLSEDKAGILFFVQGGSYALSTPVFGWILNKLMKYFRATPRVMLILGCLGTAVSLLMLGPSPWLPFIPSNLCVLLVSSALIGVSMGVVCIPGIADLVATAEWCGFSQRSATYGMASGVFLSCFHLGSFVGATLGGFLFDRYHFALTTSLFAMCVLLAAVVLAVTFAWDFRCGKGRRDPGKYERSGTPASSDETTTPLVSFKDQDKVEPWEVCELVFYEY